jgi:hypothetical protein
LIQTLSLKQTTKIMKKILVTTAICLVGAASLMAQGRINFANTSASGIRISDPALNGGTPVLLGTASTALFGIGPGSVRVSLAAGLSSASLSPVLIGTGANQSFVTNSASLVGTFQGTFPGGSNLGLAGYDGSAPVFLQLTLQSINGLYLGVSPIIQVNLATGVATATTVFSVSTTPSTSEWNYASQFVGNLGTSPNAVPEPSSMVLAGLGAASLLMLRRRK